MQEDEPVPVEQEACTVRTFHFPTHGSPKFSVDGSKEHELFPKQVAFTIAGAVGESQPLLYAPQTPVGSPKDMKENPDKIAPGSSQDNDSDVGISFGGGPLLKQVPQNNGPCAPAVKRESSKVVIFIAAMQVVGPRAEMSAPQPLAHT